MKITNFYILLFLNASCALRGYADDDVNPGFKIQLSSKGLNFVSRIAKRLLLNFFKEGNDKMLETRNANGVTLQLTKLKIEKYNDDMVSDVVFTPGIGVEYRIRNLDVKLSTAYAVAPQRRSKPSSGVLSVSLSGVSLALLISMLSSSGRFKPTLDDCRSTVDDAEMHVERGSKNDLIRYFGEDFINGKVKSAFQNETCVFARTIFVPKIERTFANYAVLVRLFDNFYYNFSLLDDPVVTPDSVISSYAGNAYVRNPDGGNDTKVPFDAPPIPDEQRCDTHMMCMYMSNYSMATLAHFMAKQHRFDYNFTKNDVSPSFAKYLRTECPGKDDMCAGTLITSLPKRYPKSNLEIFMKQRPDKTSVLITKNLINMTNRAFVTGYVRRPNGKKEFLFSANVDSYTTMKKPIFVPRNYTIETELDANHFLLYNVSSKLPDLTADNLQLFTGFAVDNYVNPGVRKTLGMGIRLPKLIDFDMTNGEATFDDGLITLASDFCETPDECLKADQEAAKQKPTGPPDYDSVLS